jgi:hypothetical protein
MFSRSHILSFAVTIGLVASAWAQTQPPGAGSQIPQTAAADLPLALRKAACLPIRAPFRKTR